MTDQQPGFGVPEPGPAIPPGPAAQPHLSAPPGAPQAAPSKKRGKRSIIITALVVVAVCAGLCGAGQLITNLLNADDWENLGEPVAASSLPPSPKPSWTPPNQFVNPQPLLHIRHDLESRVLASAGVVAPMTSSCDRKDFTGEQAATFRCTVDYDGHDVVYTVFARPSGGQLFNWEAETEQTAVTRAGLLALVNQRFGASGSGWEGLRCETFPEVALVPVGKPLSQSCYGKGKDQLKTSRIIITPTDRGEPHFLTEHQKDGLR